MSRRQQLVRAIIFILASGAGIAAIMMLAGCSSMAGMVEQLKDDHALLRFSVMTPWGQQTVTRANPGPGQSVTVSADGSMTFTSDSNSTNGLIPVVVTRDTQLQMRVR